MIFGLRTKSAWLLTAACTLFLSGRSFAQDDFGKGEDDVQVVMALYGGANKGDAAFVDVTNKVKDLLDTSPKGFSPQAEVVVDTQTASDWTQSLLIFYNCDGHLHVSAIWEAPRLKVSKGLLREEAKIDDSHTAAFDPSAKSSDPRILFAAFGTLGAFRDVTDTVKRLVYNDGGFVPSADAMGGGPLFGYANSFVVVFEEDGKVYFHSQPDAVPKISKASLQAAVKASP